MKIEKRSGSNERKILIGMIVDTRVLSRIASRWTESGLFASSWANLVGKWCVDYFERYGKCPGSSIESLFESWSQDNKDNDTIQLVEKLLQTLSGEYAQRKRESNTDLILDLAGIHFNKVKMLKLLEAVDGDISSGKVEKAESRINDYHRVEMGKGSVIHVQTDTVAALKAFRSKQKPLIEYPEALGTFFMDAFERDSFIAFMGPEKSGKSFWLQDVSHRAAEQGKKVIFFAVGDMSQDQMMMRFQVRAAKHPFKSPDGKWPYTIKVPNYIEPGKHCAEVQYDDITFQERLSVKQGRQALSTLGELRLSCHPNDSINVMGIMSIIKGLEREDWVPDVVVIDYSDILAPPVGQIDSRDQINKSWKQMRAMSQSLHCCVVTATQSDADSYEQETMGKKNFSEDKRKYSHVTGMCGINVNDREKDAGVCRLNWLVLRDGEFSVKRCVHVAGCLAIANPGIKSAF